MEAENAVAPQPARSGPRVILLACGNPQREDDGVGLHIAAAVESAIPATRLRVISAHQWAPEMAAELGEADLAIFVDADAAARPGAVCLIPVTARVRPTETHRFDPAVLLCLAESLCGRSPQKAFLLTVGAGSLGFGDQLSHQVQRAVPEAVRLVVQLTAAHSRT